MIENRCTTVLLLLNVLVGYQENSSAHFCHTLKLVIIIFFTSPEFRFIVMNHIQLVAIKKKYNTIFFVLKIHRFAQLIWSWWKTSLETNSLDKYRPKNHKIYSSDFS